MRAAEPTPLTIVVAAVISDGDGRILIARRPPGVHMSGLWEFPGGKVKDGEAVQTALVRELAEELGVTATVGDPLSFALHEDDTHRILLLFFAARIVHGRPRALHHQELRWVAAATLPEYPSPPADENLIRELAAGRYTLQP